MSVGPDFELMPWEEAGPIGIELIEFFRSRGVSGPDQCFIMARMIAANIKVMTRDDPKNARTAAKTIGKIILNDVSESRN